MIPRTQYLQSRTRWFRRMYTALFVSSSYSTRQPPLWIIYNGRRGPSREWDVCLVRHKLYPQCSLTQNRWKSTDVATNKVFVWWLITVVVNGTVSWKNEFKVRQRKLYSMGVICKRPYHAKSMAFMVSSLSPHYWYKMSSINVERRRRFVLVLPVEVVSCSSC